MNDYIKIAKFAAQEAGKLLKKNIRSVRIVKRKDGAVDLLTDADLAAQKLIIDIIKNNFPDHGILSEESRPELNIRNKEYLWVIDPIDGTSAYSVGLPTYSSSIALLRNNKPIVGAIYTAVLDEVIYGAKGFGVYQDKEKVKIKNTAKLIDAAIAFELGYHNRGKDIKTYMTVLSDKIRFPAMICSEAASLALIAAGIFDACLMSDNPKVWDVAAGKLLVEEAGGIMTDLKGNKFDIWNINGYLAGSRSIHRQLLSYINQ